MHPTMLIKAREGGLLLSVVVLARIDTAELVAGRALITTWALAEL
jgi:hypothetical protein